MKAKSKPASHNLPSQVSSFIGRERELAEVKQLLAQHRLVTLIGPGGCGKTRLALKVAYELVGEFKDGAWQVELAPLADPGFVPQTVATALGIHEISGRMLTDVLVQHLFSRRVLLLLDNCEHLITACAHLAESLLQKCPELNILCTSREGLGIGGEIVWTVPPLTLPEVQPWKSPLSAQNAIRVYARSEAVQLFINRATSVAHDFSLTPENGAWVSEICRRLDGMPLAIELAAARARTLSVQQIAQRLDDRFHLLIGGSRTAEPRQQTLAATLDWSYALLSDSERKILQRLSIFAGGCTLEAAEVVCAGEGVKSEEVLDVLSHLVEKSLVGVDKPEGGETRYHLLETIRQYALEKSRESGEIEESRNRHLDFFLQWVEQARPFLGISESPAWLDRFEAEHDNLRAALEWSLGAASRAEVGLRLAAITAIFWKLRGYHSEGRQWLRTILAQEASQPRTLIRAKVLFHASLLAFYQSDYSTSRALADESLSICRERGPAGSTGTADALEQLAEVATETGDYETALTYYEESLTLSRQIGYLKGVGECLKMIAWMAMRKGNYEQAESRLEEALATCRQSGDLHQISSALAGLGELAIRQGRYPQARELLEESLNLSRKLGEKWEVAIALGSLGWIALRRSDFREMRKLLKESLVIRMETGDKGGTAWCLEKLAEANRLKSHFRTATVIFGAAASLRASASAMMDAVDRPVNERMIAELRTALGRDEFTTAWNEGQTMAMEKAIDYALAEPAEIEILPIKKFGGLTEREREVVTWIAQGKSNREIAEAMTVGVKTVETYVTRILNKLGFDSRVQIATWAIEKGLHRKESE